MSYYNEMIRSISFLNLFYKARGRGEMERERSIYYSTYLSIHYLILACALTRNQTCLVGVLGWHASQLSYLAKAHPSLFKKENASHIWKASFLLFPCHACIHLVLFTFSYNMTNVVWPKRYRTKFTKALNLEAISKTRN